MKSIDLEDHLRKDHLLMEVQVKNCSLDLNVLKKFNQNRKESDGEILFRLCESLSTPTWLTWRTFSWRKVGYCWSWSLCRWEHAKVMLSEIQWCFSSNLQSDLRALNPLNRAFDIHSIWQITQGGALTDVVLYTVMSEAQIAAVSKEILQVQLYVWSSDFLFVKHYPKTERLNGSGHRLLARAWGGPQGYQIGQRSIRRGA